MQIVRSIEEMQKISLAYKKQGKTIGFVPTMGYLHEGHLSLIRIARKKADIVVASIFVNPTQFAPNEDLDKYPRDFERDESLCRKEQVDIIFYPTTEIMYPVPYRTYVEVEEITNALCGLSRPGHFKGVTTVVTKLFNIVLPDFAVFGQKDFQQASIIKQMVRDLNFPLQIILGPIVREEDGLAMSSRNAYLSVEGRKNATVLFQSLQLARQMLRQGERDAKKIKTKMAELITSVPSKIDYIEIVNANDFRSVEKVGNHTLFALAVFIENTRLIDNMYIENIEKEDTWR